MEVRQLIKTYARRFSLSVALLGIESLHKQHRSYIHDKEIRSCIRISGSLSLQRTSRMARERCVFR
ncbi:hypothetical protein HA466_0094770 [Hirschfeldia incana]|nr:hypothetical protein HA466_0094770 [Hirschfeldia incana]